MYKTVNIINVSDSVPRKIRAYIICVKCCHAIGWKVLNSNISDTQLANSCIRHTSCSCNVSRTAYSWTGVDT